MISVEEDLPRHAEVIWASSRPQAKCKVALQGLGLDTMIVPGHKVKTIVEAARKGCFDLLIVGCTGTPRSTITCGVGPRRT